jgi:hypothetical protein
MQSGQELDTVAIVLVPGSVDAYAANEDLGAEFDDMTDPGGITANVQRDAASGIATVIGSAGTVAPGITVVVASARLGAAVHSRVEPNGSFSASIRADSGDTLLVFATEPATSHGGAGAIEVVVP